MSSPTPSYLHHNYGLLDDIANSRSDEIQQDVYASFSSLLDLDRSLTNCFDTLPHEVHINF